MTAKSLFRLLPAILLAGGVLLGFGAPAASARSTCEARIDREAAKLSNDIYHHGRYSWQADHDRAKIDRLHELCAVPAPAPRSYVQPYRAPAPYVAPYRPAYPPAPPPPPPPPPYYRNPYYPGY